MSRFLVAAAFAALALTAAHSADAEPAAKSAPVATASPSRATPAPHYRALEKMLHQFSKPAPSARTAYYAVR